MRMGEINSIYSVWGQNEKFFWQLKTETQHNYCHLKVAFDTICGIVLSFYSRALDAQCVCLFNCSTEEGGKRRRGEIVKRGAFDSILHNSHFDRNHDPCVMNNILDGNFVANNIQSTLSSGPEQDVELC